MLGAARRTFTERGYDAATLRHIAREAGVDARMVRHYFVDKAGLFRAAMDLPIDPGAVLSLLLSGELEDLGERLLRQMVAEWDRAGGANAMIILIRSAMTHDESNRMLREYISSQVLGRAHRPRAAGEPDRQPDRGPGRGPIHHPGGAARLR